MIRLFTRKSARQLAAEKLQRLIDERRESFPVKDYAKRRAAALKAARKEIPA